MVYPNPTNGQFTVSFISDSVGATKMEMFDVSGRKVDSINVSILLGENLHSYNLDSLPSGVYFLQIKFGPFHKTQKIVLEKSTNTFSNLLSDTDFSLSPNPSQGLIDLQFLDQKDFDKKIAVFDCFGKLHKEKQTNADSISFDLSELPVGIYLFEIVIGEQRIAKCVALTN